MNNLTYLKYTKEVESTGGGLSEVTQHMQRQFNMIIYTDMAFDAKKRNDPLIECQL